jgi:large subunit ribosomal protein L18e
MSARTTNPELINAVKFLRWKANEHKAPIWDAIASKLTKKKHNRVAINISRINRYSTENDTIVVPGKVLGSGVLNHKVTVAAFNFSSQAKDKIEGIGGKCLTIQALIKENPRGSGIKIMG